MPNGWWQTQEHAQAMRSRLESGELEADPDLARIAEAVIRNAQHEAELTRAIVASHAGGRSYAEIGVLLGITRQAVRMRTRTR